jgi:hypothetical protein
LDLPFNLPDVGPARAVAATRAFAWYEEAMRLFKRAPFTWCVLGMLTLASELTLEMIPGLGVAASKVIVPVIECGMLIGAAAVDRGAPLRLRYALTAFGARPGVLAAIVGSGLAIFAAEAIAAYSLADVNLLATDVAANEMSASTVVGVLTAGIFVSLPIMFVPFAALLGGANFSAAFAIAWRGFVLNVLPLLLFGTLALVLVALGALTYGIGLVAVFPLLSAASYAAWKDIYAVRASP